MAEYAAARRKGPAHISQSHCEFWEAFWINDNTLQIEYKALDHGSVAEGVPLYHESVLDAAVRSTSGTHFDPCQLTHVLLRGIGRNRAW